MSWIEIDNITIMQAFQLVGLGKGMIKIKSKIDRSLPNTKAITFYLWRDEQ